MALSRQKLRCTPVNVDIDQLRLPLFAVGALSFKDNEYYLLLWAGRFTNVDPYIT